MRSFVIFLGVLLLFPVSTFATDTSAADTPTIPARDTVPERCFKTTESMRCIFAFHRDNPDIDQSNAEQQRFVQILSPLSINNGKKYCQSLAESKTCFDVLDIVSAKALYQGALKAYAKEQAAAQSMEQSREREFRMQLEMQQRMIDAQLEQARIQANGMALFGAGNAMINGMNQGLQNMQLPYNQPPGRR